MHYWCNIDELNNVHIKYHHIVSDSGVRGTLPLAPRCSSPRRTAMPRDGSRDSSTPLVYALALEIFWFHLLVCLAHTGYFFCSSLVLGTIISKCLVLKVKIDLSGD